LAGINCIDQQVTWWQFCPNESEHTRGRHVYHHLWYRLIGLKCAKKVMLYSRLRSPESTTRVILAKTGRLAIAIPPM